MKLRMGFVANSSSSSFLLKINGQTPILKDDLINILKKRLNYELMFRLSLWYIEHDRMVDIIDFVHRRFTSSVISDPVDLSNSGGDPEPGEEAFRILVQYKMIKELSESEEV